VKLAAVTMAYNEAAYLPLWITHYGAAVGPAHCHVIDHGSTDGSTERLGGVNRLRLPRSAHDDARRADFVSQFCAALLCWYDAVIYTDVDELLVPLHGSLADTAAAMPNSIGTAIGFNLLHLSHEEPALDPLLPIGAQRRWAWFSSAMCKPVLIRRAARWSPGFHSADAPVVFAPLLLFHLRYADRAIAQARLARTRAMPWADLTAGAHQRVPDEEFTQMLERLERMDRREDVAFDPAVAPLSGWLDRVLASQAGREDQTYRIALDVECYELWQVPQRLRPGA
jgi:hypothetical protein